LIFLRAANSQNPSTGAAPQLTAFVATTAARHPRFLRRFVVMRPSRRGVKKHVLALFWALYLGALGQQKNIRLPTRRHE
jgi:hypothetical protein